MEYPQSNMAYKALTHCDAHLWFLPVFPKDEPLEAALAASCKGSCTICTAGISVRAFGRGSAHFKQLGTTMGNLRKTMGIFR